MRKINKYLVIVLWSMLIIICEKSQAQEYPPGAFPVSGVDYASGNIGFSELLFGVEGYELSLKYNSEGVQEKGSSSNEYSPTSTVGLGWAIGKNRVVRVTQQTGNTEDDDYLLHFEGSVYELIHIKDNIGATEISFRIKAKINWKVTFYSEKDQWIVVQDNGVQFFFGDGDLIDHTATSTEYNVKWGNWIGSSIKSSNQSALSIGWNLSEVKGITGKRTKLYYDRIDEHVGSGGLQHTQAIYLKKVEGFYGKYIEFEYADKLLAEYVDPHTEYSKETVDDHDAYQERFETKYLENVSLYNVKKNLNKTVTLGYRFLNSTDDLLKKRVLTSVLVKDSKGRPVKPATIYTYYGENSQDGVKAFLTSKETILYNKETKALYGAVKSRTMPEGLTYGYQYAENEIGGSSRTIDIEFPKPYTYQTKIDGYSTSAGWKAPELFFTEDYVVAIFELEALDIQLSRIRVYEWIGDRWKASDMVARTDLEEGDDSRYVFSGHFYNHYKPDDAMDPSFMSALKFKIFNRVADSPGGKIVGGVFHAFEDVLKDEVKIIYSVGKDVVDGDLKVAVKDFFVGSEKVIKDVVVDLGASIESAFKGVFGDVVSLTGTDNQKYEALQGNLYDEHKKFIESHPEKRYHITLQKDFFSLVTSDGGQAVNVFRKNLLEDGAWEGASLPVNVLSKFVDIASGGKFFAVLDELSDFVYIYTWDGLYWEGSLTQFGMHENTSPTVLQSIGHLAVDLDPFSDSDDLIIRRSNFRTAICARNNTIVGAITDANGYHMEFNLLHHNQGLVWDKLRINRPKRQLDENKWAISSIMGNDARIKLAMGNSFVALQIYSNLDPNIVPDLGNVPFLGSVFNKFIADTRKVNSTYALTWDEKFKNTELIHLHTGWGQDGVGVMVSGDVINKIGNAHTLLVPANATSPENGKNYAFRYDGGRFIMGKNASPYFSSAFAPDIISVLTESDDKLSKNPQFFQYNAQWANEAPIKSQTREQHLDNIKQSYSLLGEEVYKKEWEKIEVASAENIPTADFVNEAIDVSFEILNSIIQMVSIIVPFAGELIEGVEALETLQKIGSVAGNAGFVSMAAHPIMNELVDNIMGTNHKNTSISNGFISVNGKLFHRNPDGSWTEVTDNAFSLIGTSNLIGGSNSIVGNYINYTVKEDGVGLKNYVKLLRNGEVYKSIELGILSGNSPMVIHQDSVTNVSGANSFVAYGPVDEHGKVKLSPFRQKYESKVQESFNHLKTSYKDAKKIKLYRVINDDVLSGKLKDYVVKSVSVNINSSITSHHYNYDSTSAQMDASVGTAIYPKVIDIPVSHNDDLANNGIVIHYYFNRYNRVGTESDLGFPKSLELPLSESEKLLTYQSFFSGDNNYFKKGAITPFYGREYYTETQNVFSKPVKKDIIQYHIKESTFDYFHDDKKIGEKIKVYTVLPIVGLSVLDSVKNKTTYTYDDSSIRLRSTSTYNELPSGEQEVYTNIKKYADEVYPEVEKQNRFHEEISSQKYVKKGGSIHYLGANTTAYKAWTINDSQVFLPKSHYVAKLKDDLVENILASDYSAKAASNIVEQNDILIEYHKNEAKKINDFLSKNREIEEVLKLISSDSDELKTIAFEFKEACENAYAKTASLLKLEDITYLNLKREADSKKDAYDLLKEKKEKKLSVISGYENEYNNVKNEAFSSKGLTSSLAINSAYYSWSRNRTLKLSGLKDRIEAAKIAYNQLVANTDTAEEEYMISTNRLAEAERKFDYLLLSISDIHRNMLSIKDSYEKVYFKISKVIEKSEDASTAIFFKSDITILEKHRLAKNHIKILLPEFDEIDFSLAVRKTSNLIVDIEKHSEIDDIKKRSIITELNSFIEKIKAFKSKYISHKDINFNKLNNIHNTLSEKIKSDLYHKKSLREISNVPEVKWIETKQIKKRDKQSGDILSWVDSKGTTHSRKLRKVDKKTIFSISNADLSKGEAVYEDFEDEESIFGPFEGSSITEEEAHTGKKSCYINEGGSTAVYDLAEYMSVNYRFSENRPYVLSAWVKHKSIGSKVWFSSHPENRVDLSHASSEAKEGKNEWTYIEAIVEGLNYSTKGVRFLVADHGAGVYIDDLTIRPLESVIGSAHYDDDGLVTGTISNNGLTSFRFNDTDQTPLFSIDQNGRGSSWVMHGYTRFENDRSNNADKNSQLTVSFKDSVSYIGTFNQSVSKTIKTFDRSKDVAIWVDLLDMNLGDVKISLDGVELEYRGTESGENLLPHKHLLFFKIGNQYMGYINGKLIFNSLSSVDLVKEGRGNIILTTRSPLRIFVGYSPVVTEAYLDGAGRVVQRQGFDYDDEGNIQGVTVNETIYDGWGNPAVQTLTGASTQKKLEYLPDFVETFDWSTGKMTGGIEDYLKSSKAKSIYGDVTELDTKYGYTQKKYETSPLRRLIRFIKPGEYFHKNSSSQKRIRYQTVEGNDLGTNIGVVNHNAFPSTTTTDAEQVTVSKLVDKKGRIIGAQIGDVYHSNEYDYSAQGYMSNRSLLPNHYSLTKPNNFEGEWFTNSVVNHDLLGGSTSISRVDEGVRKLVRDNNNIIVLSKKSDQADVRYVKLSYTEKEYEGYLNFVELEVYENEQNVALHKPVSVLSSNYLLEKVGYKLVDGDLQNKLYKVDVDHLDHFQWLKVDLLKACDIDFIRINYRIESCGFNTLRPGINIGFYDKNMKLIKERSVQFKNNDACSKIVSRIITLK